PNTSKIFNHQNVLSLTKKEKQVFEYLLRNKNRAVSFNELEIQLYNDTSDHKEAVKAIVKQLRKKIPNKIIKNVFGFGYRCVCL
ncbi:helix-turn-helix domain-containing protein, partial [Campylobacter sp. 2018MI35]